MFAIYESYLLFLTTSMREGGFALKSLYIKQLLF